MERFDFARFDYQMVPSAGDVSWNRYSLGGQYEVPISGNHSLGIAAFYQNIAYDFFDTTLNLGTEMFEEIHTIMAGVFYCWDFPTAWKVRGAFSPVISSSLSTGLQQEDIQYAGNFSVTKYWKGELDKVGVELGLGYGALNGKPDFYPIASVVGDIGKWSYKIGFPETAVQHQISIRHTVMAKASLRGSYANVSGETYVEGWGFLSDTKLEYRAVDMGLQHTYRLQPNLTSVARVGYLSENKLHLLNENDVLLNDFNTNGSFYITMGLTYNLNY